jgi:hypothetical protein
MRFFYINAANQAVGPVEGAGLEELRRQGLIHADSRVAREGESAWRSYADFFPPAGATGAPPAPPPLPLPRPMTARVIGILNILVGIKGLICTTASTLGSLFVLESRLAGASAPAWYGGWLVFHAVLTIFLSGALLISGIGLCVFREWARKAALVYAGFALLLAAGSLAADLANAYRPDLESAERALHFVQLLLGGSVRFVYPLALLIVLRPPALREALEANG